MSVLIVEDEDSVLLLIKSLIDWEGLRMRLAGEASNGPEAIEKIRLLSPDIVITDIRMPGLSGLDVTKWINENRPDTSVIVISGYKQFDYAYDALKLKVVDFLLKPISAEQLNGTLRKIARSRDSRLATSLRDRQLADELRWRRETQRQQCVLNLLHNASAIQPELSAFNEVNGAAFGPGFCQAVIVHLYSRTDSFQNYLASYQSAGSHPQLPATVVSRIIELSGEIIRPKVTDLLCASEGQTAYFLVNYPAEAQPSVQRVYTRFFAAVLENLSMFTRIGCIRAVGGAHSSHVSLPSCLQEASELLPCSCLLGDGAPLLYSELARRSPGHRMYFPYLPQEIKNAIADRDSAALLGGFRAKYAELRAQLAQEPILVGEVLDQFVSQLWAATTESVGDLNISELTGMREFLLSASETPDELGRSMEQLLEYQFKALLSCAVPLESRPVQFIQQYIRRNFAQPLSLSQLAGLSHLSASYLSSVFKKETGASISDFITDCRIARAKELLNSTLEPIASVSEAVGYQDEKYFSRVFSRRVGVRPSEYRKLNRWYQV